MYFVVILDLGQDRAKSLHTGISLHDKFFGEKLGVIRTGAPKGSLTGICPSIGNSFRGQGV